MLQLIGAQFVAAVFAASTLLGAPQVRVSSLNVKQAIAASSSAQHPPKRARPATHWRYGITPQMLQVVARVNLCEEGGNWHVRGASFRGGLGWRVGTNAAGQVVPDSGPWHDFRHKTFPSDMAAATPRQQAWAMFHFVAHYQMAMPDQAGCTGGY